MLLAIAFANLRSIDFAWFVCIVFLLLGSSWLDFLIGIMYFFFLTSFLSSFENTRRFNYIDIYIKKRTQFHIGCDSYRQMTRFPQQNIQALGGAIRVRGTIRTVRTRWSQSQILLHILIKYLFNCACLMMYQVFILSLIKVSHLETGFLLCLFTCQMLFRSCWWSRRHFDFDATVSFFWGR